MASRLTTFIVVLIVTGTLVAGLIVGAQRDEANGPVDLIITNGRVYTGQDGEMAEAVAVRGNKILRVGSNRDVKRMRRPQTVTIDAHGASVLPGFNDAHAHMVPAGLALSHIDLVDATTLEEIQDAIGAYATAHPELAWVRGRGWYYEPFPGGMPTRQQLDVLVPDRPAYLTAYDGHTGWANSAALQLAGITRRTPNPANGTIVKDAWSGEPTGVLKESAMELMRRVMPQATREDRLAAVREATAVAHRYGVTSVQNAGGDADDLALYGAMREAGELNVRIYTALSATPGLTEADIDQFDRVRAQFPDDPLLKTGAIKLMLDGVVETHTAALLEPYADRGTTGQLNYTPADLTRIVTLLDRRGWQVLIHAIGDRAVRVALDAFEAAAAANPASTVERRHRIEHIETIDPIDVPRFAALGVIASQQPFHGSPDQLELWTTRLGRERADRGWMATTLRANGARVVFGSDWPVVSVDPRFGLHVAATRTAPHGQPEGGFVPAERMPLASAIDAYTAAGAYASFDEQRKGTLKAGMLADIVILTSDVFEEEARLLDAEVATTIFDGRVVYDREHATTLTD